MAVKSPGTGVTLWTDVADDRECATILAAAGERWCLKPVTKRRRHTPCGIAAKFYRGYWKQINNVLFACTLVGVDWLYQERPEIADQYSLRIAAGTRAVQRFGSGPRRDGCTSARPREKGCITIFLRWAFFQNPQHGSSHSTEPHEHASGEQIVSAPASRSAACAPRDAVELLWSERRRSSRRPNRGASSAARRNRPACRSPRRRRRGTSSRRRAGPRAPGSSARAASRGSPCRRGIASRRPNTRCGRRARPTSPHNRRNYQPRSTRRLCSSRLRGYRTGNCGPARRHHLRDRNHDERTVSDGILSTPSGNASRNR